MQAYRTSIPAVLAFLILLLAPTAYTIATTGEGTSQIIRLATTTSTDNSGLLSYLLPSFERQTGFRVHVIAVGTGKALRMGRDGDADVLLVHAPAAEIAFVNAGYGRARHAVMYNDFVLVGPSSSDRKIPISADIGDVLRKIAEHELTFISRGDDSGTHKKELSLWRGLDITPEEPWYREVGQGMGKVLQMASELGAYTLADRGTWLAYEDKLALEILNQSNPKLYNPYHIIAVNPQRYPDINHLGARALVSWITSTSGQALIGSYSINETLLFKPAANQLFATQEQHTTQ